MAAGITVSPSKSSNALYYARHLCRAFFYPLLPTALFIIPSEEHVKIYFHGVRATGFQAMSRSVTSLIFLPATARAGVVATDMLGLTDRGQFTF